MASVAHTDLRVTTDDLLPGQPAARRPKPRGVSRNLFCTAALCLASLSAQARTVPVEVQPEPVAKPVMAAMGDVTVAEVATANPGVKAPVASSSVRDKAAEAAAATLTALLPRLAANDTMPLMDRSAMFASDLSRLLASSDLHQGGVPVPQESVGKVQTLLKRALTLLGTPYRWGGTSPDSGFDCSGLVGYVFRTALGIELPRVSRDMARNTNAELVSNREDLQQGDLVFFGQKGRVNHVGIYVGDGQFVHAPRTGKDVQVSSLTSGYWSGKFLQARRVAGI